MAMFSKSDDPTAADKAAKRQRVQDLTDERDKLTAQAAELEHDLGPAKDKLKKLARDAERGGSAAAYSKQVDAVAALETAWTRKTAAAASVAEELSTAKADLFIAETANRTANALAMNKERGKGFDDISAGIALAYKGLRRVCETNTKISVMFGPALTTSHGGTFLSNDEVLTAITFELARISASVPTDPYHVPALPGSKQFHFGGLNDVKPLSELVAQANKKLVEIVTGPGAHVEKPKAAPATAPQLDPDGLDDAPATSAGPTIDAATVMAGIQPRKLGVGG